MAKKSLASIQALYKKYGIKPTKLKLAKSKFKMPKMPKISGRKGVK
jgi:hypothetical protein